MDIEKMWQDEMERQDNFYKKIGKLLGYTGKECIACKRNRVEKFDTGLEICEKCGTDQNTREMYQNEYGSTLEFYF